MSETRFCEYEPCGQPYEPVIKDQRFHSDACRAAYHRERPTAISGTRRQIRELVDGTIEVKIHIDPAYRKTFHELFPDIDKPIAIAPLKHDFEKKAKEPEVKGGPLAKLAGQWCNDPKFWEWINMRPADVRTADEEAEHVGDKDGARKFICRHCRIESRRELDHNNLAADIFHKEIRIPFSGWLVGKR